MRGTRLEFAIYEAFGQFDSVEKPEIKTVIAKVLIAKREVNHLSVFADQHAVFVSISTALSAGTTPFLLWLWFGLPIRR
jgi:hypothetical protein